MLSKPSTLRDATSRMSARIEPGPNRHLVRRICCDNVARTSLHDTFHDTSSRSDGSRSGDGQ
jgi:hypothetical protein